MDLQALETWQIADCKLFCNLQSEIINQAASVTIFSLSGTGKSD